MQFSTKQLCFQQSKLRQTLTIKNESDDKVIYKVKLNNTQAFHIYPGKGFIAPHDVLQMQISLKKYGDISGKLLLIYAYVLDTQQVSFDRSWNKVDKSNLVNQLIEMCCAFPKAKEIKSENSFKKIQFSISEPDILSSSHKSSQKLNESKSEHQQIVQSIIIPKCLNVSSKIINNQNISQTQQQSKIQRKSKTFRNIAENINDFRFQKEQNMKLKQKLFQNEQKLRYYQEIVQKDINNSIASQKQESSLNSLNVCLLMLVCLFFGFFLAKLKLQQPEI